MLVDFEIKKINFKINLKSQNGIINLHPMNKCTVICLLMCFCSKRSSVTSVWLCQTRSAVHVIFDVFVKPEMVPELCSSDKNRYKEQHLL